MLNRKGQNTAEYAILIALVVAAAVGMQTYIKMSLQGKVKDALDAKGTSLTVGNNTFSFTGNLFEPAPINSTLQTTSQRSYNETLGARGSVTKTGVLEQTGVLAGGNETYR